MPANDGSVHSPITSKQQKMSESIIHFMSLLSWKVRNTMRGRAKEERVCRKIMGAAENAPVEL